jgi:hypothetical protein
MCSGPAQRPPQIPSSVSNKKIYARRSYPLIAPICWSFLSAHLRLAAASEPWRSVVGLACQTRRSATGLPALPTRHDARPPLSHGYPLHPCRVTLLMPPCRLEQPLPLARRLQASPGHCLRQIPHTDEPLFSQAVRRCCNVMKTHVAIICFMCFWCFIGMLQLFLYRCCKSRSRCCICCNGCTRMLQRSISNV